MAEWLFFKKIEQLQKKTPKNKTLKLMLYYCYDDRILSFNFPLRLWKESQSNASAVLKQKGLYRSNKSQELIIRALELWELTGTFCFSFQN